MKLILAVIWLANIKNDPYSRIRSCNEILEGVDKYGQDFVGSCHKKRKDRLIFQMPCSCLIWYVYTELFL